jgi:hypothetical protein
VKRLKEGGRSGSESAQRNRTRSVLVIFESAVAVMLLVGAGLLIRSLIRLQNTNPGFDSNNVLTIRIDLPRTKYEEPQSRSNFWEQFQSRVGALPGVESVGLITELPLSGQPNDMPYTVEGRAPDAPTRVSTTTFVASIRIIFAHSGYLFCAGATLRRRKCARARRWSSSANRWCGKLFPTKNRWAADW